jgi:hypothetical protein
MQSNQSEAGEIMRKPFIYGGLVFGGHFADRENEIAPQNVYALLLMGIVRLLECPLGA